MFMEMVIISFFALALGCALLYFSKKYSLLWLVGVCALFSPAKFVLSYLLIYNWVLFLVIIAAIVTWSLTTMHRQKNEKFCF